MTQVARAMRDSDVGAVLVTRPDDRLKGIVTDRDLVVRSLAGGDDPEKTPISKVCSLPEVRLSPQDTVEAAIDVMRTKQVRRVPIVEGERPVGVVSLGDLARKRDPESALGEISSGAPTR